MMSYRSLPTVLFLLALGVSTAFSQEQRAGRFETEVALKVRLDYLLFVPESAPGEKLPLIVFLHGAGERGDDLEKVKMHGPPKIVETMKDFPFIVLSPQCERRSWWRPEAIIRLVDHVVAEYPVDEDRVYLTGLSMGGYGSWALAAHYPDRFAAVAPICGGGEPETAAKMKEVPLWVFHGARDRVVSLERSKNMVDAVRAAGGDARLTVYPEAGHDSWTKTYDDPRLYRWFLSHRLSQRSRSVREIAESTPEEVGLSSRALGGIDRALEGFVGEEEIAGAVAVVARRGRVVYAKAFGKADVEAGKPMKRETIFRIYSMTKPVASVAAMILHEEGKFQLDDAVSKHIPELRGLEVYRSGSGDAVEREPAKREPTIRDLLRHTSGLTYGFFGNTPVDRLYQEARVIDHGGNLRDMVRKLGKLPLLHQPGTKWHCSVSVDVLGHLVEVLSGTSLDRFFRERIFAPLDMRDTGFHVPAEKLERFAANYGANGEGGLRLVDAPSTSRFARPASFLSGGGGLVSTARDYLRFCQMLLGGGELDGRRILRPETVSAMTSNQLPDEAMPIGFGDARREGVGFGLGFSVRVARTGGEATARLGEYGWGGAASTHFWISPRDELIVLALSQCTPYSSRLEDALKPLVYGALVDGLEPAPVERQGAPAPRSRDELRGHLGGEGPTATSRPLHLVLAAGPKDHGPGEHDYPLWQKRWTRLLAQARGVRVSTASPWPSREQFRSADVILFFSSNPGWSAERAKELDDYLRSGGGAVFIHFAVNGRRHPGELAKSIGLAWARGARYRHGEVELTIQRRDHPITRGLEKLRFVDESYWSLTGDPGSIDVLATAVEDGEPRPLLWTRERGLGRVFVSILGHYTWTFDDPLFRLILLRAVAWTAREHPDRLEPLATVGARLAE
ncbi:MAG: serine hydrolase [Planctomycetota bacterium]|nr:serine hydrolase [Planctomycetota bacterium]